MIIIFIRIIALIMINDHRHCYCSIFNTWTNPRTLTLSQLFDIEGYSNGKQLISSVSEKTHKGACTLVCPNAHIHVRMHKTTTITTTTTTTTTTTATTTFSQIFPFSSTQAINRRCPWFKRFLKTANLMKFKGFKGIQVNSTKLNEILDFLYLSALFYSRFQI